MRILFAGVRLWVEGSGVREDGYGVGGLGLWREGDAGGDEAGVVGGEDTGEEGMAEVLDGWDGACERGFGAHL